MAGYIMIVDNCKDSRTNLKKELMDIGYKLILTASNADEAFGLLDHYGNEIDLILLEFVLPDLNGVDVCSKIKTNDTLKHIPIMMVTTVGNAAVLEKAFDVGAIDYITKPFDHIELKYRIYSIIKLKKNLLTQKQREMELLRSNKKLEKYIRVLEQLSLIDPLTGISNRRKFDVSLEAEWRRASRNGSKLSLLLIDIDEFKTYNDTYGHLTGDNTLTKVAESLTMSVHRSPDVVARYGGEEFAAILPETDLKGAVCVAEKMRTNIYKLAIRHKTSIVSNRVTISIGVANVEPKYTDISVTEFIEYADKALYEAKKSGRNQVKYFQFFKLENM